jgi:hypothetical protein
MNHLTGVPGGGSLGVVSFTPLFPWTFREPSALVGRIRALCALLLLLAASIYRVRKCV